MTAPKDTVHGFSVVFEPNLCIHDPTTVVAWEIEFLDETLEECRLRCPTTHHLLQHSYSEQSTQYELEIVTEPTSHCVWKCDLFDGGGIVFRVPSKRLMEQHLASGDLCLAAHPKTALGMLKECPTEAWEGFSMSLRYLPSIPINLLETLEGKMTMRIAASLLGFFFVPVSHEKFRLLDTLGAAWIHGGHHHLERERPKSDALKYTLHSSSGLVKTSSVPCIHEKISLPFWFNDAKCEDEIQRHYDEAVSVGQKVLKTLCPAALHSIEIENEASKPNLYNLLRTVIYEDEGSVLAEHSDKSWITVLATNDVGGLQMLDFDGSTWVPLQVATSSSPLGEGFIINVGDALQMASQGIFLSKVHRAVHGKSILHGPRVSIPLFMEPIEWPQPYVSKKVMIVDI